MPEITFASWNIEKDGQSSEIHKQTKVSDFIDRCCLTYDVSVVFLCEVHSARIDDFVDFIQSSGRYPNYDVFSRPGGNSNAYVILIRKDAGISPGYSRLALLNRDGLICQCGEFWFVLAHFKSGQTDLTKGQIEASANFLNGINGTGKWIISGDMNWSAGNFQGLTGLPDLCTYATCWEGQATQKRGGVLDWCLKGPADTFEQMQVTHWDMLNMFGVQTAQMDGPDHKPIGFTIKF